MNNFTLTTPCFNLDIEQLVDHWIELERRLRPDHPQSSVILGMARRQLQEAAGLVVDPVQVLKGDPRLRGKTSGYREFFGRDPVECSESYKKEHIYTLITNILERLDRLEDRVSGMLTQKEEE